MLDHDLETNELMDNLDEEFAGLRQKPSPRSPDRKIQQQTTYQFSGESPRPLQNYDEAELNQNDIALNFNDEEQPDFNPNSRYNFTKDFSKEAPFQNADNLLLDMEDAENNDQRS